MEDAVWITKITIIFYCNGEEIFWIKFSEKRWDVKDSNHGLYKNGKTKYRFPCKEKHKVPC